MSKYEKKVENRLEVNKDGIKIMCEVTEWKDKDGFLLKDKNGDPVINRIIADKDYYSYMALRETYARGQITDDALAVILDADNLRRFCKDGDFVREVMDTAVMDARIIKTKEFEAKWQAALLAGKKYPQARDQIYNEILGNIFKDINTAALSNGSSRPAAKQEVSA